MSTFYSKQPTATLFFDTRRILKDGRCPVKLVIYYNKQKKRYNTDFSLSVEDWDRLNSVQLKDKVLKKLKTDMEALRVKATKTVELLGDTFSFEAFEVLFYDKQIKQRADKQDVYSSFEVYIGKLEDEKRIGTARSYIDALKSLRSFSPKLEFKNVTVDFLNSYERHMLENGRSVTTIGIYLRSLRAIINIAKADKIISEDQYPFGMKSHRKYEIPKANNIKKALDESAITDIVKYEPLTEEEAKARDLWLFSFYCNGMNMADIFALKYENIDGNFIYFHRKKTIRTRKIQEPLEIFISEPVAAIIKRWGNKERLNKNHIFDVINSTMTPDDIYHTTHITIRSINAYMKRIAKRLGIDAKVTTYVARHSWATTLLRNGVSTAYISKGFGHASFATTEQYLGGFTQDQKKDVAEILTKLANG